MKIVMMEIGLLFIGLSMALSVVSNSIFTVFILKDTIFTFVNLSTAIKSSLTYISYHISLVISTR